MEYDAASCHDFRIQVLILEQSQHATTVTVELNSCSSQHSNLALPVSCVTHRVKQRLIEAAWAPERGVDQTSFSYLTRGWTKDPRSIFDAKGRQVMLMNQPPADFNAKVTYDLLKLGGYVLLDGHNNPVRDVPGLPLTLETDIEAWFITGLRRSLRIDMKE